MNTQRLFRIQNFKSALTLFIECNHGKFVPIKNVNTGFFASPSNRFKMLRNIRHITTYEAKDVTEESFIKRILKKIPFLNVSKQKLKGQAYLMYEAIADKINYEHFFDELDLPDTFYSWFVITELHIWLLSVRSMTLGDEGRYLRNCMLEALWVDVGQRVKKLGATNPSNVREQIGVLSEQLQAALIAYDEGLLSEDIVLAGALWRRFYQQGEFDAQQLELLVKYVRKQVRILDHLSNEQLRDPHNITWAALTR